MGMRGSELKTQAYLHSSYPLTDGIQYPCEIQSFQNFANRIISEFYKRIFFSILIISLLLF